MSINRKWFYSIKCPLPNIESQDPPWLHDCHLGQWSEVVSRMGDVCCISMGSVGYTKAIISYPCWQSMFQSSWGVDTWKDTIAWMQYLPLTLAFAITPTFMTKLFIGFPSKFMQFLTWNIFWSSPCFFNRSMAVVATRSIKSTMEFARTWSTWSHRFGLTWVSPHDACCFMTFSRKSSALVQ